MHSNLPSGRLHKEREHFTGGSKLRDRYKIAVGRTVGGAVGAIVGMTFGSGVGIAAAGTAIAGTVPLLLIGLFFGGWVGARIAKRTWVSEKNDR